MVLFRQKREMVDAAEMINLKKWVLCIRPGECISHARERAGEGHGMLNEMIFAEKWYEQAFDASDALALIIAHR